MSGRSSLHFYVHALANASPREILWGGGKKEKKSGCLEVQNEKNGLKSVSRRAISVGVDTHMLGNE